VIDLAKLPIVVGTWKDYSGSGVIICSRYDSRECGLDDSADPGSNTRCSTERWVDMWEGVPG